MKPVILISQGNNSFAYGKLDEVGPVMEIGDPGLTTRFHKGVNAAFNWNHADDVADDSHNHVIANIDEITGGVGSEDLEAAEDFGDFTCDGNDAGCTVDTNAIALTTDTTGNYA